mgnify:FL=1
MSSICKMDCCHQCDRQKDCGGCTKTDGHPFGGRCVAADCIKQEGIEAFFRLKDSLIAEINSLGIPYLQVNDLELLNGFFVNLEYTLPNGQLVKFLKDNNVYLGNQIEIPKSDRCYGLVADELYLLVCEYGCEGADPEIVLYKKIG